MRSIWDRLALLLSLTLILAAALVGRQVFDDLPHLEDEFAYLWQARVMADGKLTLPTPEFPKSFVIPFVVDYQGQRFAKYPPGWPAVLSLGVRGGLASWVNPLLAGLAVWLTYRLGKRIMGGRTGFLGALLLGTSPIFLIQSGSLLSHLWSLLLTVAFVLAWLDGLEREEMRAEFIPPTAAGFSLGLLVLTRPLTALAVTIPFLVAGSVILVQGPGWKRKRVLVTGGIPLLFVGLFLVWQKEVTGSFTTNPYTLWWPYDKYGFGKGFGVMEGGHTALQGWRNTRYSLRVAASDFLGWLKYSWIALPFGLWASRRSRLSWYLVGITLSLVLLYLGYWVGSWLLGPRYYFEALPGLALLSAAGITWLAGWEHSQSGSGGGDQPGLTLTLRRILTAGVFGILIFANLYFYLPARLEGLRGLYGIERSDLVVFESAEVEPYLPALVIIDSERWMPYGSALVLESPELDSPLIFAWSMGALTDRRLADFYRDERRILYYYPDREPNKLYAYPLTGTLIE